MQWFAATIKIQPLSSLAFAMLPQKRWMRRAIHSLKMTEKLESESLDRYYRVRADRLSGADLMDKWVQLHCDSECQQFLDGCEDISTWRAVAASCLSSLCMSVTDANGLLGRGQMHVLSKAQVRQLLQFCRQSDDSDRDSDTTKNECTHGFGSTLVSIDVSASSSSSSSSSTFSAANDSSEDVMERVGYASGALLDVGAGDGNVTEKLAWLFESVSVTEVSEPMIARLTERGYSAYLTDTVSPAQLGEPRFQCVSCLNVLDRCSTPLTLMRQLRAMLDPANPRAVILIAVVLPFCPFVENGTEQLEPDERFPALERCATFESAAAAVVETLFAPAKLRVVAFSRVPYLSQGDLHRLYYVLSDAIFVLARDGNDDDDSTNSNVDVASPVHAAGAIGLSL
jgi:SAM-dependent methyltransferase